MVKSLLVFILFAAVTLPCGDVSAANGRALSQRGGIDINGDGKAELLVRSADARILAGRLQDGVFQFSPVADPGVNERIVGVLDLNGNGKSDLVFQRLTQGEFGEVRGWYDFDFLFGGVFLRNVKRVWNVQAVGDLDGDGFADLVWRYVVNDSPDTGVSYIWFTNGVAVTQVRKRGAAPLSWQLLGAADTNHDGADDLIYVSPDGSIRALMATPARTCANLSAGALPTGFIALAMADMTGFGRGDILIRNITTGENSLISLNATGVVLPTATANPDDPNASCTASASLVMTTLHTLPATDIGWQFYAADDYNGDGIADVVWKKPDGSLTVWLMTRVAAASSLALRLAPNAKVHGVLTPVILANAGTAPAGFVALNSVTPPNTHTLSVAKFGDGEGNVVSSPAGISCGATCAAAFRQGSSVSLTATPIAGSRFVGWFDSCSGAGGCSVTMSGEKLVSAAFGISLLPQQLTVAVTGTGSGSVSSAPPGINCTYVTSAAGSTVGQPCRAFLPDGTNVTLAASAAADSTFVGWSGPCSGTGTCVLVMDSAKTVTAVFNKTAGYKVVVGILRGVLGGDGTVTSSPAGINCGSSCSATYASGTTVVLTATPATGSRFTGWGGACGGTGVCTLFVNSTFIDPSIPTPMPNVTASFERTTVTMLSVTTAGTGGGTVTSSPIGISCGVGCNASFPIGTVVTLAAVASGNATFIGWTGACGGTGACVLTMNIDMTVGAIFDVPPQLANYTLTVARTGLGSGTVVSTPAGIACGATCMATFSAGSLVTLTATPDSGSQFNGWGGACIGTGSCVVSMTQMHGVTARFDPPVVLNTIVLVPAAVLRCVRSMPCAVQLWATVAGGNPPFYFAADSFSVGAPPLGMTIDLNGILGGTPQVAGIFDVGFCVIDIVGHKRCAVATVEVAQAPCVYNLSPSNRNVAAAGGSASFTLTTGVGCFWAAVSNVPWLVVGTGSGSGSATITVTASANTTSLQRIADITVAGQTVQVIQAGVAVPPPTCAVTSIRFTSNPTAFGFINGAITPVLGNVPITCTWAGNLGSTSTRQITTNPNGSFSCTSSDVASWSDSRITITAAVTACTNVAVSIVY